MLFNFAADDSRSILKVVHKHGPCAQLGLDKVSAPLTHVQILLRDQSRVESIQSRLSKTIGNSTSASTDGLKDSRANIPANSGSALGISDYIVTVGLGTPKKDLTLIFDTGSVVTWTQCETCVRYCYKQKEPIFDPSQSTSYENISCSSQLCSDLISATCNNIYQFDV